MQELHPLTFVQCLHFIKHFVINHSYICLRNHQLPGYPGDGPSSRLHFPVATFGLSGKTRAQQEERSLWVVPRRSAVQRTATQLPRRGGAKPSPCCFILRPRPSKTLGRGRRGAEGGRREPGLQAVVRGGGWVRTRRRGGAAPGATPARCPGAPLASLYLHTAEPQQLSHDSSTATPCADMAPGRPPPNGPGRARARPGLARSRGAPADPRRRCWGPRAAGRAGVAPPSPRGPVRVRMRASARRYLAPREPRSWLELKM